ncbi:MAG: PRK06851 family protein [Solirubrobacterales bacterium]
MGTIRMVFPGGNTCRGFHSFYDHIIGSDAARIFVLKGGPGVGKSSFMKRLGEDFARLGHDVEYHWCSSDNNSLDGLVLPQYGIALMDGTAPHVVDPKNPGGVDEIINLGEYWNEAQLVAHRAEIIECNRLVAKYFKLAYLRLATARTIWDEWAEYYGETVPPAALRETAEDLKDLITSSQPVQAAAKPPRHLFASAITPDGVVSYANTLWQDDFRICVLQGHPGTGVQHLLERLLAWAEDQLIPVEAYHNPFAPDYLEMLIFRANGMVVLDGSGIITDYTSLLRGRRPETIHNLNQLVSRPRLVRFENEIESAAERFEESLQAAIGFIHLAKLTHDEMEKCYVPAMDFAAIENAREKIRQRILGYIERNTADEAAE